MVHVILKDSTNTNTNTNVRSKLEVPGETNPRRKTLRDLARFSGFVERIDVEWMKPDFSVAEHMPISPLAPGDFFEPAVAVNRDRLRVLESMDSDAEDTKADWESEWDLDADCQQQMDLDPYLAQREMAIVFAGCWTRLFVDTGFRPDIVFL